MHDFRFALRSLYRAPAFTIAAVATLALGIGANAAIFSVVDGVLLRPAPIGDIDGVMMVWQTDRQSGTTHEPASVPDYRDFQQRARGFSQLAALSATETSFNRENTDPRYLSALSVSHEFFSILGLRPIAGQLLNADQDSTGGTRTVVISEEMWEQQFQRNPSAVGSVIRLGDRPYTVAGVLPREADFGTLQLLRAADYGRGFAERGTRARVDVWIGAGMGSGASRDNHPIILVGRLAKGVNRVVAQQELTTIAADLERTYPTSNANRGVFVEPFADVVFGSVEPALLVLLGAVGLVLLVACGNVANLLLVRGASRFREVTVRVALGASTWRLVRQFMVESAVLTAIGAALGVMIAQAGLRALMLLAPASLPRVEDVRIDGRVLLVTLAMSVGVALLFGMLPVLQSRRRGLHSDLQGTGTRGATGGRVQARLRGALVVAELSMAAMLMVGAGLLVRSLWQLQDVNPGFSADHVLKAEFQLPASRYPQARADFPNYPEVQRFYADVQSQLSAVPGVQSVAVAAANPLSAGFTSSIRVVGREAEAHNWPEPSIRNVSASYFETMRVPVTAGRGFEATDNTASAPVLIINEAASKRYFDGQNAIGQKINMWGSQRTVVGIVGNERIKGVTEASPPAVYMPLSQAPIGNAIMIRTSGDPSLIIPALRRVVQSIDPQLPLFGVEPLAETLSSSFGPRRFMMITLLVFAGVALVLAVVGVHGVLSYTVTLRSRELGIRMALGADARDVQSLVVRQGAGMALVGLCVGLVGAFVLTKVLSSLLFGVGSRDPLTFGAVSVVMVLVALVATVLPARAAARTDPLTAIREE